MAQSLYHPGRIMSLHLRDEDGNDIIVLDICGPDMGGQGICLLTGMSGLMHAPRSPVRESSSYQEGSTPSDFPRVDERIIDFRLATKGDTETIWEQIESLLWTVLGFKHDCYLRMYSKDNTEWRELKIRLDRKPKDDMTYVPGLTKHMAWGITAVACDPWWYSETLTSSWTKGTTAATASGMVIVENSADQECWLQFASSEITNTETWTLPDALGKYATGHPLAGQQVTHPLPPLTVGHDFLVDTHPLAETLMVLDDSQQWAKMKAEAFLFPLAPHTPPTAIPVKVTGGTAASTVTVFMLQRWDRPFGGEAL